MKEFKNWDIVVVSDDFFKKYKGELKKVIFNRHINAKTGKTKGLRPFLIIEKVKNTKNIFWIAPITTKVRKYYKKGLIQNKTLGKYFVEAKIESKKTIINFTNIFPCEITYLSSFKNLQLKEKDLLKNSLFEIKKISRKSITLNNRGALKYANIKEILKKIKLEKNM